MYHVLTDGEALEQVAALPAEALAHYLELLAVLELVPWNGAPLHKDKPDSEVRTIPFGPHQQGLATYLVLEEQQRVDMLQVAWAG